MLGGAPLFLNSLNKKQHPPIDAQFLPVYGSSQTYRGNQPVYTIHFSNNSNVLDQPPPLPYYEPAPADIPHISQHTLSWPFLQADRSVFDSSYEPNSSVFTSTGSESVSANEPFGDDALLYAFTTGSSRAYPSDVSYAAYYEPSAPSYTAGAKSHDVPQSSDTYTHSSEPGPSMTLWPDAYSNSTYTADPVNQGSCMLSNFSRLDSASFIMSEGRFQGQEDGLDIADMWRSLMVDSQHFDTDMQDGFAE